MLKKGTFQKVSVVLFLLVIATACTFPDDGEAIGCDVSELIAALNAANANPDPDTIILGDACLYGLTDVDNLTDRTGSQTGENGANGLPVISTPITIEGHDSRIVRSIAPGTPEFRIFFISSTGELTLNNVYVENGVVLSASNSNNGGGIYVSYGSLALNQSHVMNNTAAGLGGGIYMFQGSLTSDNTSISFNDAESGGAIAGYNGTISLDNYSVIGSNTASRFGGAIDNGGVLIIHDSRFDNNEAGLSGGAISCPGAGMGIGELILDDVLFNSNIAGEFGGGISVGSGCPLTITDSHFTLNQVTTYDGGAIYNMAQGSISDGTRFDDNSAASRGGAIYNGLEGILNLDEGLVRNNEAINGTGGGVANFGEMSIHNSTIDGNVAGAGGGIFNTGLLTVANSTVSHNTEAGIYATPVHLSFALGDSDPDTVLINTTVSGNQGELEGGVYMRGGGAIVHSTITNNSCNRTACGVSFSLDLGVNQIKNSIVADNIPGDCSFVGGPISNTSLGENLDSDGSCPGFTLTGDPVLGPLTDNGGATWTHALMPLSPAVDGAMDCSDISGNPVTIDQRGEPRPFPLGGYCDLGSYENQGMAVLPPSISPSPSFEPKGEIIFDTLCWLGPGSMYGTAQSMLQGTQVDVVGLGEDGEYAVVYSTRYMGLTCWVPIKNILIPDELGELPVIKAPAPPTSTPTKKPEVSPTFTATPCEPGAPCD
ncbi:MAG: hypothetical protein GTO14_13670 [Anaerolineales bacterium]|nr:hypothetical protein [Anaerolineales bacterium]